MAMMIRMHAKEVDDIAKKATGQKSTGDPRNEKGMRQIPTIMIHSQKQSSVSGIRDDIVSAKTSSCTQDEPKSIMMRVTVVHLRPIVPQAEYPITVYGSLVFVVAR
jgi:hypothetical protein